METAQPTKSDAKSVWKNMTAALDFSYLFPTTSSHKVSFSNSVSSIMVCDHSFTGWFEHAESVITWIYHGYFVP